MKKLQLNKKVVSALNKAEMRNVNGGLEQDISIASCQRGSAMGKDCCDSGRIDLSLSTVGGNC
jgi:hypothetical protein